MMIHRDACMLRTAIADAGPTSRRRARTIRADAYRTRHYESAWSAPASLADCLAMDHFGCNTLNDQFFANDPGTHGLAKSRAKERLAWRVELSQVLTRLGGRRDEWAAVIDAIADGAPIRLHELVTGTGEFPDAA